MLTLLLSVLPEEQKTVVEKIFRRYRGMFLSIAIKYLHDMQRAEDAVQESMVKIILHIDDITALPDGAIKNYCAMMVRNTAIDIGRKEHLRTHQELTEDIASGQENLAETLAERLDAEKLVADALSQLSEDEVRLLYLRHEKGLTYREIAGLMGSTEDAVKKRAKRLMIRLREIIGLGGMD